MGTCVYCQQPRKLTKEHVLSDTVLEAFPKASKTFDEMRGIVHGEDPLLRDLCAACNSGLSRSDQEAGRIARTYLQQVIPISTRLEWDSGLLRLWAFKTAANCDRAAGPKGRGWWKGYLEVFRLKADIPDEVVVLFGAWKPIGPLASNMEIPRPIQTEEALVNSIHLSEEVVRKELKAAWSIKIGYGVFLVLVFNNDLVVRRIVLGELRSHGWLMIGSDELVAHRPFNVITSQRPSFVADPRNHMFYYSRFGPAASILEQHVDEVE